MISNVVERYNGLSLQKKAVIWFTLATIIQNGILFLATPIYTRIMPDSDYGTFSLYQSWQQIISIISVIALDRCVTVGFMKFADKRKEFLSSIQMLMTLFTILFALIVFIFNGYLLRLIKLPSFMLYIMLLISLLNNTMLNWSWYQRYNNNYKKLFRVTVFSTLLMQFFGVLSVVFIPYPNKGITMVLGMALARLIIYGYIYVCVFKDGKTYINEQYYNFAIKYSIAVVPHALSQIILNSSDRIMIEKYCGAEKAAYYGVAYSIVMAANIIAISISSAVQPWFFERLKERKYNEIGGTTNVLLIISAIIALSVTLFAPEAIGIMAPESYQASLGVFPSIAASVYFNSLYLYFANIESYYERPIYFSIATGSGAVLNIILNMIFIPIFGFTFAGYSTLLCFILFALLHYLFMKRICKIEISNLRIFDEKFILLLSLIVLLLEFFATYLYLNFIVRLCTIIALIVCVILFRKTFLHKLVGLIRH